jgi:hypothetical protein
MKLFLVGWFLLVCSVEPVSAGPVAAAVGIVVKAVSAFAASSWIGGVIVGIGKSIAVGLLNMAIGKLTAKKVKRPDPIGVVLQTQMGDDLPLSFNVGRRGTAGKRKYWGVWGTADKTTNAYFTDVVEIGSLPSRAGPQGLKGLFIGDTKCTVLWNEPHPDGRGYPISEFRKDGKDFGWVKYLDGTQTTADPFLIATFGTLAERLWIPTMIGRGKQAAIITLRYNSTLFPGDQPGLFEPASVPFYDIRKDSSVGGNGSHRWNDQATWEPSENNAVIIYNLVRGIQDTSGQWIYGGQNVSAYRLPASSWMAAANECDRVVDGRPQFRCGAEVSVADEPLDVIDQLRLACNGRFVLAGGAVKLLVGAPGAAVFSFTDQTVLISDDQELDPWPSLSDTHNTINASYPDPNSRWAMKDSPEYSVEAYVNEDQRELSHDVPFRATCYPEQVQALQKTITEDGRRFRVHEFTLPPIARLLEPGDVVSWTSVRNGYTDKLFILERIIRKRGSLQRVTIKEIDPEDYDPPQFYIPPTSGWIGKITAPIQPMFGWQVEPATLDDNNGRGRRPSIKVRCAPDQDDVRNVWVKVRLKETGVVVFDSDGTPYGDPYQWILNGTFLAATDYQVSGKYVPFTARETAWSEWLDVKTPNALIAGEDIFDNAIIATKIADAAVEASKLMNEAVTNIKLAEQAVSTTKIQVAAVTAQLIADQAVISDKLADAAVTGRTLAQGAIDATKFASSIEPVTIVDDGQPLPSAKVTASIYWQGALYQWNGSAYTKPEAEVGPGSITQTEIADGAVTTPKLVANAVSADKIAANAVTAGKIAAGAVSADQIAANAIIASKIAGGAISAEKLAVGKGTNWIVNSDWAAGIFTNWGYNTSGGSGWNWSLRTDSYAPEGGALEVYAGNNVPTSFFTDVRILDANGAQEYFSVTPGQWYELSCYYFGHRSIGIEPYVEWTNASGGLVSYSTDGIKPANQDYDPGKNLGNYLRFWKKWQAPPGAVRAHIFFRCWSRLGPSGDSYVWFTRSYFGEATANQAEPSQWSIGGVTLIGPGNITTNAVTADKIAANAVTAGKINAGAVTADALAANSVTGAKIQGGTISGDKIAGNTITGDKLVANTITARSLILTDFNNIADQGFGQGDMSAWYVEGLQAYLMDGGAGDAAGWRIQMNGNNAYPRYTPCNPGEVFHCEAYVNNQSGYRAVLYVQFFNSALNTITQPFATFTDQQHAWVRMVGKVTAPAGAVYMRILLHREGPVTSGGPIFWTKPMMRRAANAELIVDGSVTANKISVNSLDAIAANLGNVNISNAIIGTLQVGSSNIQAGAVTVVSSVSAGNNGQIPTNTEATILQTSVSNPFGNPVLVIVTTKFNSGVGPQQSYGKMYRNGQFIRTYEMNTGGGEVRTFSIHYCDVPSAGTNTYTFNVQSGTVGFTYTYLPEMTCIVYKR